MSYDIDKLHISRKLDRNPENKQSTIVKGYARDGFLLRFSSVYLFIFVTSKWCDGYLNSFAENPCVSDIDQISPSRFVQSSSNSKCLFICRKHTHVRISEKIPLMAYFLIGDSVTLTLLVIVVLAFAYYVWVLCLICLIQLN